MPVGTYRPPLESGLAGCSARPNGPGILQPRYREGARMSRGEVIHTSSTGAQKAGNDEPYSLLPADSLRLLARHFGVGSRKYEDHNWAKGMPWSRLFDALNRHLW